ncbi:MAG: ribosome assembly cofactor RimP [Dysgonamonadaceae bacterium]|nr:ribosome assembly cofactor RimP [Dysgonamonadaceae bacterium]
MIDKQNIECIVNHYLERTNHFLVEVKVTPDNVITVEIDSDNPVAIDDCVALSRHIESQMNRETEDFSLEVGSAGIGSPLRNVRQYHKNIGNELEVLTINGKKLTGILKSVNEKEFVLTIEKLEKQDNIKRKVRIKEDLTFGYEEIKKANYLIRFK